MAMHRPPPSTDPQILAGRLAVGWMMIDAEPNARRRHELEDHWLRLLAQYVAAVDLTRPDPAAAAPPALSPPARLGSPALPRVDHQQGVA
jgi:hypothetical protein